MRGRPKLGRQNASPVDQVCRGQLSVCFEGAGNSEQYKGTCQPEHRERTQSRKAREVGQTSESLEGWVV